MAHARCGICGFNNSDGIIRNDNIYACKSNGFLCWKSVVLLKLKKVACECKIYNRKIIYALTYEGKQILLLQPLCARCYISYKGQCQMPNCKLDREWISPTAKQQYYLSSFHGGKLLKYCSPQCAIYKKTNISKSVKHTAKRRRRRRSSQAKQLIPPKQKKSTDVLEKLHNYIQKLEQDKLQLQELIYKLQQDNAKVRKINKSISRQ